MAGKFGEEFAREMLDRGRRELGAVLYGDGQVAQPMYPLRPGFSAAQAASEQTGREEQSVLDQKLAEAARDDPGHDDPGRDDRGRDDPEMDR